MSLNIVFWSRNGQETLEFLAEPPRWKARFSFGVSGHDVDAWFQRGDPDGCRDVFERHGIGSGDEYFGDFDFHADEFTEASGTKAVQVELFLPKI